MILARELTVSLADLVFGSAARNSENFVVIFELDGHWSRPLTALPAHARAEGLRRPSDSLVVRPRLWCRRDGRWPRPRLWLRAALDRTSGRRFRRVRCLAPAKQPAAC